VGDSGVRPGGGAQGRRREEGCVAFGSGSGSSAFGSVRRREEGGVAAGFESSASMARRGWSSAVAGWSSSRRRHRRQRSSSKLIRRPRSAMLRGGAPPQSAVLRGGARLDSPASICRGLDPPRCGVELEQAREEGGGKMGAGWVQRRQMQHP
jgi:hypothetical protein